VSALLLPVVHAGVDALLTRTLHFDERDPVAPRRPPLTERDLDILYVLAELRYLTTTMVAALAWGTYNSRLRDRLHVLFHAGLIRRFRPPIVPRSGGAQWIYELDTKGHRLLAERRPESCPPWKLSELHAFSYAEHDLELNALLCELAARAAAHRGRAGALLHAAPFTIQGPRSGAIDPDHEERPLDAHPSNELPDGDVVRPGLSHRGPLEPDATLIGKHHQTGELISVLIEYDRTRRATKLTSKFARYDYFLADGWRRTRFATQPDEPAVLFVTSTEQHLPNALREADRQLTAATGPPDDPTRMRYAGREELALTSRARLLAGDDTIFQVSPRPAVEAGARAASAAIAEAQLPLAAVFG